MTDLLPVFDKYYRKEDADFYFSLFETNGLHPELEKPYEYFDAIIGHARTNDHYLIRLPKDEFSPAQQLITTEVEKSGVPADYYLRDFTNNDLKDILYNSDEWSRQDIAAAEILLRERTISVDEQEVKEKKQLKVETERKKNTISLPVLILFYVLSPWGAVLPIAAGMIIYFLKDTDRDGNSAYVFSDKYRKHGLILGIIGTVSTIFWLYELLH